jgi:uncharacterized protein (DUF2141 family)
MNYRTTIFAFVMALGFAATPNLARAQPAAQSDEIRIVVNGLRNQKGWVICSLWSQADSDKFTKTDTETKKVSAPIQGSEGVCEFKSLPAGAYAVTVFHDENGDGKFNRRFLFPLEGYGFTNNVNPQIKAPGFDECKFEYSGKGVLTETIKTIYR